MSNYVFVLDVNYRPIDPCHPSVARKLLRNKKAAVFRRYPFTIILFKKVDSLTQPIELKLDPGSKTTGMALVRKAELIWGAELTHRGEQIKANLDARRAIRRSRRNRKVRYRKQRFLNRKRSSGSLPPSLQHRVDTTMTWVNRLIKLAPITSFVQELVKFDLQQLENPEVQGTEYQQGTLFGYEVREYLLEKWQRKCTYCQVENVPLQIEHIQSKAKGGSDRISNLCIACEKCNKNKGTKDIKYFLKKKPELLTRILKQAKAPLKDAAAVNSTRGRLFNNLKEIGLPVKAASGGQTKYNRIRLELEKRHYIDAGCTGLLSDLRVRTEQPLLIKATGHGNRRLCRIDKYGFPGAAPRKVYKIGWKTGDIARVAKTKGKYMGTYTGRVVIQNERTLELRKGKLRVSGKPSEFTKLHCKDGYSYEI